MSNLTVSSFFEGRQDRAVEALPAHPGKAASAVEKQMQALSVILISAMQAGKPITLTISLGGE